MQIWWGKRDVDVEHIVEDVEDQKLREELRSCQHFLVDSQRERTRHKVFKYAIGNLNAETVDKKLNHFFNNLKCAVKPNLAFGFNLMYIEDGGFRYFHAHENNTLLDRSQLVFTRDDLAKLKDFLNKTDVIESCSREKLSTKWRFYNLTNLTVFAALIKDVPMGCENAVSPKPLRKNQTINKNIQDNHITITCASFVRFLSICLAVNAWKKKIQNCSIYSSKKWTDWAPISFKESTWTTIPLLKIC